MRQAICIISKPSLNSNWSYSPERLNLGLNRQLFWPLDLEIWRMTLKKQKGTSPILLWALCIISKPSVNSNWSYSPETLNSGPNRRISVRIVFQVCWMTLDRARFLCYFKICASFHSHMWIQTGVTVRNRPIWVKIDIFSFVTLKFERWTW